MAIRPGYRTIRSALREKKNVMHAVMMRDMRTRFFNHGIGFLLVPLWPLAHIIILLIIYGLVGRVTPFGESLAVFFASGLLPTLTFTYVSRFMCLSVILNKPMLAFPVVKVLDIMAARAVLEILSAFMTLILVFVILILIGDDPFPRDPFQAMAAFLSVLLLAIGVGTVAGVLTMFFRFFSTLYSLMLLPSYLLSGTLFVASAFPESISYPLSFNPVLQGVEWMRTSYYEGYSDKLLDKQYLIVFGLTALMIGLLLERTLRRLMLEG